MNKLLKNYGLSLWIVRVLYVLLTAYVQYDFCYTVAGWYGITQPYVVLLLGVFTAILYLVIFMFLVNMMLRISKIFYVPVNEFKLLAVLCACIQLAVVAIGKLLLLLLPYAGVWITAIFNVVGLTCAMIVFYMITSKLYTNVANRPYYLRAMLLAYIVFLVVCI